MVPCLQTFVGLFCSLDTFEKLTTDLSVDEVCFVLKTLFRVAESLSLCRSTLAET